VEKFIDRLGTQLEAMASARAAQDYKAMAELAHWLKGAGGTVGFDAFTAPARQLEQLAKEGKDEGMEQVMEELGGLAKRLVRPGASDNNTDTARCGAGQS
jgi:HPt (histidine-containing phosphotransfer) domain-containing protein